MKPTAAKGPFPYPHRTCAEWSPVDAEREALRYVGNQSGFMTRGPRNSNMAPRYTSFGMER